MKIFDGCKWRDKRIRVALTLLVSGILVSIGLSVAVAQSRHTSTAPPKFLGYQVTLTEPPTDDPDGFFPKGPASVCVEMSPKRQCYTAPDTFGRFPEATVVTVDKNLSALLFAASSGGVSGYGIHLALLRPGLRNELEDLFMSDVSLSNQSQYVFWDEPQISDSQIFVTANFVWGPDESHYEPHRFIISAYLRKPSSMVDDRYYYLEDRYMTIRKYDIDNQADILKSERPEILGRLKRIQADN